jgi:hypothetical protein
MLIGNERLIIIIGMAHSGTTILAYVLKQHPDVFCFTDGTEAWILENTLLLRARTEAIQQLLNQHPTKRILLKRPWTTMRHADWLEREMPNARYLYCLRPFEEIARSWAKPTSLVDDHLRHGGPTYQRNFYRHCLDRAMSFATKVPHFRTVHHPELVAEPKRIVEETATWLGLSGWTFDVSQVSATKNIRDLLYRAHIGWCTVDVSASAGGWPGIQTGQ